MFYDGAYCIHYTYTVGVRKEKMGRRCRTLSRDQGLGLNASQLLLSLHSGGYITKVGTTAAPRAFKFCSLQMSEK